MLYSINFYLIIFAGDYIGKAQVKNKKIDRRK